MLQFVTDSSANRSVEDQIKDVLAAGCSWITIDPSGMSDDEVKDLVRKIKPICIERQSFLLINDKTDLAKETNIGGVVLSRESDTPSQARMKLGAAAVIGVEVESTRDIDRLTGLDIDYVVMPFDKLGMNGISNLCRYMEEKEMELPRVASYGVDFSDIAPLMEAGCNGVSMSDALAKSEDIEAVTKKAIALLKVYEDKEKEKLNN